MNFIHRATCPLSDAKASSEGQGCNLLRLELPQAKVQDPNIGCGHSFKLINEWELRRALYRHHYSGSTEDLALFEVRRIFAAPNSEAEGELVASKDEETFILFSLAMYQVRDNVHILFRPRRRLVNWSHLH